MLNAMITSLILLATTLAEGPVKDVYKVNTTDSKILWTGKKVTGSHAGTINVSKGDLMFDAGKLVSGSFAVDMTSIVDTDLTGEYKEKLEGHLKSDDFFGVDSYPTATLKVVKVKSLGKTKYEVTGDITIKGTTQKITFPAEVIVNGDKVTATALVTIDRSKFNIKYGSNSFFDNLGDKVIYDDFVLDVTLVASK